MPANPECKYCHGIGIVYDWVPYGSTNVRMETECDCVFDDWIECPICEGTGQVEIIHIDTKKIGLAECLTCQGDGYISPEKYDSLFEIEE